MEAIFTRDTMQMETILETLCKHLSLRDLLQLENVSHTARAAVRKTQYEEVVHLRIPHRNHESKAPMSAIADRRELDLLDLDPSELGSCGPILTDVVLDVVLQNSPS